MCNLCDIKVGMFKYLLSLFIFISCTPGISAQKLATPSKVQYEWQERERIMFIHFGVATWLGKEYDEKGDFDLSRIDPRQLNTDRWCEVAKSWGAKQIIFVAKHVGGFCWWQTNTTEYSVKNTPWRSGKGDLMKELAASCKKYDIKLGVYLYPGDIHYGAGIGSGGKTNDPAKQDAYNKIFREQLTEVLTRYGEMAEVWFDGNCEIFVDDILDQYASHAVIFQSKKATIRWPGTESGMLSYPAWNSLSSGKLGTGISTQFDDDPDGDAWAPLESDAPLYNHNWFWSTHNETKRKPLEELMKMYYRSVGYGGTMLLNCAPDSNGAVTAGDKAAYKALGDEISRRFSKPLITVTGKRTMKLQVNFDQPTAVNHVVFGEDYREGHRIRAYELRGIKNGMRSVIFKGSSVGRKKIDAFSTGNYDGIELAITEAVGEPMIRYFNVYNVDGFVFKPEANESADWNNCGGWNTSTFKNGRDTLKLVLNDFIKKPGQYELKMVTDVSVTGSSIDSAVLLIDGTPASKYLARDGWDKFYISRTDQIGPNSSTWIIFYMRSDNKVFQNRGRFIIRERN
jgi:alpha-L-fucosidase